MSNNRLSDDLSTPLNGARAAKDDINSGIGNVTIDQLSADQSVLVSGTLEYFEKQGKPACSVGSVDGTASLELAGDGAGQP